MGEPADLHIGGYHLTESLGSGGMGTVLRATVEAEGKPLPAGSIVAVKLLHPHLRELDEFVQRFHREAKLASLLRHPNVVRVMEHGVDGHTHYLAMEYAEGVKLSDLLADGEPLSPQQVIEVMSQVCEALKAASHIVEAPEAPPEPPACDADDDTLPTVSQAAPRVRCLVHRDIKPSNILVQPLDSQSTRTSSATDGRASLSNIQVKLLDFGLAKDTESLTSALSRTGQSLGTPAYMSPEQCTGGEVDQRSDIYSLGVCGYQMITGTLPFAGPSMAAFARQHAEEAPSDIRTRNPLCPAGLADCIMRCLAKRPEDRYATAEALQKDLQRVARGRGIRGRLGLAGRRAGGRKRLLGFAAAAVVLAALGVAGAVYLAGGDPVEQRPATDRRAEKGKRDEQDRLAARHKHEQEAEARLREARGVLAAGRHDEALRLAGEAWKQYADTPSAPGLRTVIQKAEEALRLAREAAREQEEFAGLCTTGKSAMAAGRYATARRAFEAALAIRQDAEVRGLLERCTKELAIEGIAVGDFVVKGDLQAAEAAKAVSQALREEFAGERFRVVPPEQFADMLRGLGLGLVPEAVYAGMIQVPAELGQDVPRFVLGSVEKSGRYEATARLVDVGTGKTVQTASVSAADVKGLKDVAAELARVLQMTDEEKQSHLEKKQGALLAQAREKAEAKQYDAALALYEEALAVLSTKALAAEVERVRSERKEWLQGIAATQAVDPEFARSLATAQGHLAGLPPPGGLLRSKQRVALAAAEKAIRAALARRPADPEALAVRKKLDAYARPAERITVDLCRLEKRVTMQLARIPAGTFAMGSPKTEAGRRAEEGPRHQVKITKPFYMGVTEITQAQWHAVMGTTISQQRDKANRSWELRGEGGDFPMYFVSWLEATAFCRKLSDLLDATVRLPTEAEWEYACRAGSTGAFCFGDEAGKLADHAWYKANAGDAAHPVGRKKPNGFGLHDVHGNVSEWCADWYGAEAYAARGRSREDPVGPASGSARVVRGGCWSFDPADNRASYRHSSEPDHRNVNVGFRVVVQVSP